MFDKNGFKKEDGFVTVHNYSYENDEYTGTTDEWVIAGSGIPAKSTLIAPPAAKKGYARVFDGSKWVQVKDHRGETWYTEDGQRVEIKQLGQEVGLLKDEPIIPKTDEQLKAEAESLAASLRFKADSELIPLQDAIDLDMATDDELSRAKELKKFRVLLSRWSYPDDMPEYPSA